MWPIHLRNPHFGPDRMFTYCDSEDAMNTRRLRATQQRRFQQAAAFLRQAHKGKHGLMFELALHTGMRPEEYLGLKWGDIDLQAFIWGLE